MRVTQSIISRAGIDAITAQRNRLATTQERAVTGLQINRPSDDPVDYRKTLDLKDSLSQAERYLRGISLAGPRIATTENALSDSASIVLDARVVAQNATSSPDALELSKGQIEDLFEQLVNLGNRKSAEGAYVFSGVASDTPAFEVTGTFVSGSPAPTVSFTGDVRAVSIDVDDGVSVDVTRNGEQAFQGPVDVFAALTDLWTALDTADSGARNAALQNSLGDLDAAREHLVLERAALGNQQNKVESFEDRLEDQRVSITSAISVLESVDSVAVFSELVEQETALQASLAVTSRLISPTLLDFI